MLYIWHTALCVVTDIKSGFRNCRDSNCPVKKEGVKDFIMGVDPQQHRIVTGLHTSRLSSCYRLPQANTWDSIRESKPLLNGEDGEMGERGISLTNILQGGVLGGLWIVLLCQFVLFLPIIWTPNIRIEPLNQTATLCGVDCRFDQDNTCNLILDVLSPISLILLR